MKYGIQFAQSHFHGYDGVHIFELNDNINIKNHIAAKEVNSMLFTDILNDKNDACKFVIKKIQESIDYQVKYKYDMKTINLHLDKIFQVYFVSNMNMTNKKDLTEWFHKQLKIPKPKKKKLLKKKKVVKK